jgi:hypothetical protein
MAHHSISAVAFLCLSILSLDRAAVGNGAIERLEMYLIQILLPVYDNAGNKFEAEQYTKVRLELTEAFGGSTAYSRAPAEGLWHDAGKVTKDDIVIVEVMTPSINKKWWARYRRDLTERFKQELLVIRAQKLETL